MKDSPRPMVVSLNSILIWIGIITVFIMSLVALMKKSSSSTADGLTYEDVKRKLQADNFVQNYTTIYPSSIELKKKSSDNSPLKISFDGTSSNTIKCSNNLNLDMGTKDFSVTNSGTIHFDISGAWKVKGNEADLNFYTSHKDADIFTVNNKKDNRYWYYNWNGGSGQIQK